MSGTAEQLALAGSRGRSCRMACQSCARPFGGFSAVITGDQAAGAGTEPSFYTVFSYTVPGSDVTLAQTALTFSGSVDPSSGTAWNLDDVSLVQDSPGTVMIPEPSSLALAIGSMALVWGRWRGHRSQDGQRASSQGADDAAVGGFAD